MNLKQLSVLTALLLLSLTSFAVTKPLNSPQGLALDSKGNLYVANNGGNQILIYGPAYAQQTAKTISKGVSSPSSVAIVITGHIWVANLSGGPNGTGNVTEYSSTGVQNPNATITDGIDYPYAIATDGLADIWVENNFSTVTVYPAFGTTPIRSVSYADPVTAVAPHNMWTAFGGNSITTLYETSMYLVENLKVAAAVPSNAYSLAWGASGLLYCGSIQNKLNVANFSTGSAYELVDLGYFPFGIAVDSIRARVYVSDANHNRINVYSTTTGALLHTIQ